MPDFDLSGKLTIDTSELGEIPQKMQEAVAAASGEGGNLKVGVDSSQASAALGTLEANMRDLGALSTSLGEVVSKENLQAAATTAQWNAAMRRLTATERDAVELWWSLRQVAAKPIAVGIDNTKAIENLRTIEREMGDTLTSAKVKIDAALADSGRIAESVTAPVTDAGETLMALPAMWRNSWYMAISQVSRKLGDLKTGGIGSALGGLTTGRAGATLGGVTAVAGFAAAASITSAAIDAAQSRRLMERSTKQIFGAAAGQYEAEARRMADSTGYMTTSLEQAQLTIQRARAQIGPVDEKTGAQVGQVNPLVGRIADIAATTGLPQFADDVNAVAEVVAQGLQGAGGALLDFGIRLDDAYVLSLSVNRGFKAMGEEITDAQMAQARYNAIMAQTATINGKAAETQDDATRAMQKYRESMDEALANVGEAIMPVVAGVANFIANIPQPLLTAGTWVALGLAVATGLGGAVIAIRALRTAVINLGTSASLSATQVATASAQATGPKGLGGASTSLGNLATKAGAVALAVPIITDAIAELIAGINNEENYHENKYTDQLNTIQDDQGGPGLWDKAAHYLAFGWAFDDTQTAVNKEWNTTGFERNVEANFHAWLSQNNLLGRGRSTSTDIERFRETSAAGYTTYLDLPGGGYKLEPHTYDELKSWWRENFTQTRTMEGMKELVIVVRDKTDRGVATDAYSYAPANY